MAIVLLDASTKSSANASCQKTKETAERDLMRRMALILAVAAIACPGKRLAASLELTVTTGVEDDILIPVFDTSLGTLTGVSLTVELVGGDTLSGGTHDHPSSIVVSTNTTSTPQSVSAGFRFVTPSAGEHGHAIETPAYSGGGVDLGTFSTATSTVGPHVHGYVLDFLGHRTRGASQYEAVFFYDYL